MHAPLLGVPLLSNVSSTHAMQDVVLTVSLPRGVRASHSRSARSAPPYATRLDEPPGAAATQYTALLPTCVPVLAPVSTSHQRTWTHSQRLHLYPISPVPLGTWLPS
jgi:hypothetical protein